MKDMFVQNSPQVGSSKFLRISCCSLCHSRPNNVVLFIQGYTSSLCATKRHLQDSGVVPDESVVACSVHASFPVNIPESLNMTRCNGVVFLARGVHARLVTVPPKNWDKPPRQWPGRCLSVASYLVGITPSYSRLTAEIMATSLSTTQGRTWSHSPPPPKSRLELGTRHLYSHDVCAYFKNNVCNSQIR